MIKRVLLVFLALLFLPTVFAENAEPKKLTNEKGYVYTLFEDDTAEIVGYTGKEKKLNIPDSLDGHTVVSIAHQAFYSASFSEVTVPASVKTIKEGAFEHCHNLKTVKLSEGLERIKDTAFWDCNGLTSINFPDSLLEIGQALFFNCKVLKSITLSDNHPYLQLIDDVLLTRDRTTLLWYPMTKKDKEYAIPEGTVVIGSKAFSRQPQLTKVTVPDSVELIGDDAFENCPKLQEINIPPKVTRLGSALFGCDSLLKIHVSAENPVFYSIDGVLFDRAEHKLVLYPSARKDKRYIIPNDTQIIGQSAFVRAQFSEVEIPENIHKIEHGAFFSCNNLISVIIPEGVEMLTGTTFEACRRLKEVSLPRSLTTVGDNPFLWSVTLSKVNIDEDHPALAMVDEALVSKKDMRLIWYPQTSKVKSFAVPEGIMVIGAFAFGGCEQLTEIVLPKGLQIIRSYAFARCTRLQRIVLPSSLFEIDKTAFLKDLMNANMTDATFVVEAGSYADNFCQAYGLKIEYAQ